MKAWMNSNFAKFATELRPLIDVRIEFFVQYLKRLDRLRPNFVNTLSSTRSTLVFVNHCFSQICNRVTALD